MPEDELCPPAACNKHSLHHSGNFSSSTSTQISYLHSRVSVMGLYTDTAIHKQSTSGGQQCVTELHTPTEPLFVFTINVQAAVDIVPRPVTTLKDQPKYRPYKTTYSFSC